MNTATDRMPKFNSRQTDKFEECKNWREILQCLVRTCSMNQATDLYRQGRVPARAWKAYVRVWHFNSILFSSHLQEEFYSKHGLAALRRRIDRTRAAFGFSPISASR